MKINVDEVVEEVKVSSEEHDESKNERSKAK